MTVPPPVTQATLDAALEAAARAYADELGLDIDNLRAHADPGDSEAGLKAWRANLVDSARAAVVGALPVLAAAHAAEVEQARADGAATERERIAQAIEAELNLWMDGSGWDGGMSTALRIARAGTSGGGSL